jgi:hypothetical protein
MISGVQHIYLDKLNLSSFFWIIMNQKKVEIIRDKENKCETWFAKFICKALKLEISFLDVFAGNLYDQYGKNIMFLSAQRAADLAFSGASNLLNDKLCENFSKDFTRNNVELYLAKKIQGEAWRIIVRVEIFKRISKEGNHSLLLRRSNAIDEKLVLSLYSDLSISFYDDHFYNIKETSKELAKAVIKKIKYLSSAVNIKPPISGNKNYPGTLLFQENGNFRLDERFRSHPAHWLNSSSKLTLNKTFIVVTNSFGIPISKIDMQELSLNESICLIYPSQINWYVRKYKNSEVIKKLRHWKWTTLKNLFSAGDRLKKIYLYELLSSAEDIAALIIGLNIGVFVNREPQFVYSDAAQIIKKFLNFKTVTYQYSNLSNPSPLMMSCSDYMLLFSKFYESKYIRGNIRPENIIEIGYPYAIKKEKIIKPGAKLRNQLKNQGVDFIVCFFDESVQKNNFGLISPKDYIEELHLLLNQVLIDNKFAVIIKTQYMNNLPSILFAGDQVIKRALDTRRYVELAAGHHRNEIYPAEAAIAADICINHKFGATAAIEAAMLGRRTILLNTFNLKSDHDKYYKLADIEYYSMKSALDAILEYKSGSIEKKDLGNWEKIIQIFSAYQDDLGESRISEILTDLLESNNFINI